ncbi:hypothetical protein SAMN05216391_103181 [Lachnospiraceae bacterium KHCPX20]|nr:hypothetical protein SAMN05216391_103181 [Lachnospiraceae bacterium KHCPX20]
MAKFYLNATKLKSAAGATDSIKSKIDKQQKVLSSISLSEWGVSNAELKELRDSLEELKKDLGNESKAAEDLSRAIGKIVDIYTSAEENLSAGTTSIKNAANKPEQKKSDDENVLDKILDMIDRIPEPTKTMLMFLIGCIPGVNVGFDLLSIYGDLKKFYFNDEKREITTSEGAALAMDIVCLLADCVGVAEAYKAFKGAKAAKEMAKGTARQMEEKASKSMLKKEAAEKAAEKAEKDAVEKASKAATKAREAEKAAKAAENVDKGTKAGRRIAKNAGTAERKAEKAEKIAKEAAKKESEAKNLAKNASRKAMKDKKLAKEAAKETKQAERNVKKTIVDSMKPNDRSMERFVGNDLTHRYADHQSKKKDNRNYREGNYVI